MRWALGAVLALFLALEVAPLRLSAAVPVELGWSFHTWTAPGYDKYCYAENTNWKLYLQTGSAIRDPKPKHLSFAELRVNLIAEPHNDRYIHWSIQDTPTGTPRTTSGSSRYAFRVCWGGSYTKCDDRMVTSWKKTELDPGEHDRGIPRLDALPLVKAYLGGPEGIGQHGNNGLDTMALSWYTDADSWRVIEVPLEGLSNAWQHLQRCAKNGGSFELPYEGSRKLRLNCTGKQGIVIDASRCRD